MKTKQVNMRLLKQETLSVAEQETSLQVMEERLD